MVCFCINGFSRMDNHLEGDCFVEGGVQWQQAMVHCSFDCKYFGNIRNNIYFFLQQEKRNNKINEAGNVMFIGQE